MTYVPDRKKRIEELDILKAIGIIGMVAGHSDAPFTHFVYLFHMAIFFIASGFCFHNQDAHSLRSAGNAVLHKIRRLWLPYFTCNTFYVLLHNGFIRIGVYTDRADLANYVASEYAVVSTPYSPARILVGVLKGAFFRVEEQLIGPGWFLGVLFVISVTYLLVEFLAGRISANCVLPVQFVLSAILLAVGYYSSLQENAIFPYHLDKVASFYCLYHIGRMLAFAKQRCAAWGGRQFLPILLVSFGLLCVFNRMGSITFAGNQYVDPAFMLAASILGWAMVYSAAYFIKQVPFVRQCMICIGQHTLPVVLLHGLFMKLVAGFITVWYQLPPFCVAAYPNLYGERGAWWLLYTVVGVAGPVALALAYQKGKGIFAARREEAARRGV